MSLPVFVIPHRSESSASLDFLRVAVQSLQAQTDPRWRAVIVDDNSPLPGLPAALDGIADADPRISILAMPDWRGPGRCRNTGIQWAADRSAPFVLFMDADDLCHPDRLARTAATFESEPEVSFVYSTFSTIDENGRDLPLSRVTASIREIRRTHEVAPVEGREVWRQVALETGYTTPSNTVAVRTSLAVAVPFPGTAVSEDSHTWLRMFGTGARVAYLASIPSQRRIPSWAASGSASRQRFGGDFYWMKVQVDYDGLMRAYADALARGAATADELPELISRFYLRQARTMAGEGREREAQLCGTLAAVTVRAPELQNVMLGAD